MQWGGWWMALVVFLPPSRRTARNAAQRSLTADLVHLARHLVRFLYGLPLAALALVLLYTLPAKAPELRIGLAPILAGWRWRVLPDRRHWRLAAGDAAAHFGRRRHAVQDRGAQVALFWRGLSGELPTYWALAAMAIATIGVALLSLPPRQIGAKLDWRSKAAMYGLNLRRLLCDCDSGLSRCGAGAQCAQRAASAPGACSCAQACRPWRWAPGFVWRDRSVLVRIAQAWRVSLLAGCMGSAASLAWFRAYALQSAASVRTLGMVEVVFSYLVSRRVLKEQLRRTEKWGIARCWSV
ncbi:EamA/RhaT family transporter [Comamonas sp. JC664]|uniref:EamA/RhaT family transporter n=1 Tax=Comamonas sp. JC664 TaxID=2801917 RepID=UPI003620284F